MNSALLRCAAAAAITFLLVSCLGGGGYDAPTVGSALCESISVGGGTVSGDHDPACVNCTVTDPQKAADGDLDSFAQIDAPNATSGQGAWIIAKIQPGIVFPSGQRAGVLYVPPSNAGVNSAPQHVMITTYLDNAAQDTPTTYDDRTPEQTNTNYSFRSFVTTKAFDEIRVEISDTQLATGPYEIHEICSNGTID